MSVTTGVDTFLYSGRDRGRLNRMTHSELSGTGLWAVGTNDPRVLCLTPTSRPTPAAPTVVCYQANRDELRRRIIQWLEAEIIPDGWFSKGSNYSEILDKYFKVPSTGVSQPCSVLEKVGLPLPLLWLSGDPKCALITRSYYGVVKVV